MTRNEAKKLLPIIQAYADGKVVQFEQRDGVWCTIHAEDGPTFDTSLKWRIKPEPMECWVVVDRDGDRDTYKEKNMAESFARNGAHPPYTIHHMREVED